MFFELKKSLGDGREESSISNLEFTTEKSLWVPQDYIWRTYLSREPSDSSDIVFSLHGDDQLYAGDVGYVIFTVIEKNKRIIPSSYFPFGGGSSWGSKQSCIELRGKGIAGAIERLILEKFRGYTLQQSCSRLSGRNFQLESYGLNPGKPFQLNLYKRRLDRSLESPHFKIVRFPSWISNPKILQSQGSK